MPSRDREQAGEADEVEAMTNTNKLAGRALAEACARAMGVRRLGYPSIDEMLAWLHERGEIEAYSNNRGASFSLGLYRIKGTIPMERGATITEALQRLVVAVAETEKQP